MKKWYIWFNKAKGIKLTFFDKECAFDSEEDARRFLQECERIAAIDEGYGLEIGLES